MIRIRPATEADFAVLLQVQQAAFGEYANLYEVSAWTTETLDSLRQDAKDKRILVAEADGVVVGSVRFWTVAGVCVIRLLSVSPAHQGHGVGKALMREIERVTTDAHKFYACTMLRTARNIHFFLSLGYKAETVIPQPLPPPRSHLLRQISLRAGGAGGRLVTGIKPLGAATSPSVRCQRDIPPVHQREHFPVERFRSERV